MTKLRTSGQLRHRSVANTNAAFGGPRNVGSPRLEVGTSHLFAFGSTGNFKLGKSRPSKMNRIDLFVLN